MYIVLGGYLHILGAPCVQPVADYRYMLPTVYLFVSDIANPDLFVCGCQTWICLDIILFYDEQRQSSIGSALPACQKKR